MLLFAYMQYEKYVAFFEKVFNSDWNAPIIAEKFHHEYVRMYQDQSHQFHNKDRSELDLTFWPQILVDRWGFYFLAVALS